MSWVINNSLNYSSIIGIFIQAFNVWKRWGKNGVVCEGMLTILSGYNLQYKGKQQTAENTRGTASKHAEENHLDPIRMSCIFAFLIQNPSL